MLHLQAKGMSQKAFSLCLSCLRGLSRERSGGESQTLSISNSLIVPTISAATDSPWTLTATSAVLINKLPWLSVCERTVKRKERVMKKRHSTIQTEKQEVFILYILGLSV